MKQQLQQQQQQQQQRELKGRPPPLNLTIKRPREGAAAATALSVAASDPAMVVRRPVIIHSYPPKVIKADSDNFRWLVQKLTGSSVTRLRCKKFKPGSGSVCLSLAEQQQQDQQQQLQDDDFDEELVQGNSVPVSSVQRTVENEYQQLQTASGQQLMPGSTQAVSPLVSLSLWSPIPTPNFSLQQEFLKELPMLSSVISPGTQQLASWR